MSDEDAIPAGAQIGRVGDPTQDMNHLTAMAGVFDTQGRATPFSVLDNLLPNMTMDRPSAEAERPYEDPFISNANALSAGPPVVAINSEGVLDDALPTQLVDTSHNAETAEADGSAEPGEPGDTGAGVTVVDSITVGGETPDKEPSTDPALDESTRVALIETLPEGWERFDKVAMGELATTLGVEVKRTDRATTLANRIKDTLGL